MKRRLQIISLMFVIFSLQLKAQTNLSTAVDFTATDIHGQQINLFEILDGGQHVLIDFFFINCGPCQQTTPNVKEAYERLGCNQHEVFFMEISPLDNNSALQSWVNNFGIEYPTIGTNGGGSTITSQYGVQYCPTVILIAPDRSIVINNIYPGSSDALVNALAQYGIEEHDCTPVEPECEPATNLQAIINGSEVSLSWDAPANEEQRTYTITRNGIEIVTGLTVTNYTDVNVPDLDCVSQEYCVMAVYTDCTSEPTCTVNNVTPVPPATNVQAVIDGYNVNVSWDAPYDNETSVPILHEDFESLTPSSVPDNWLNIDADGDGNKWMGYSGFVAHSGEKIVLSFSHDGMTLTPDNWLISPNVYGAITVNYYYCVNDGFPAEHYAVCASSTGTNIEDFTIVFEETANGVNKGGVRSSTTNLNANTKGVSPWIQRTIDLPAGTKYVAFRHYNCTDQNFFILDDVTFWGAGGEGEVQNITYTVTRNGAEIATGLTETTYTDNNVATGTHEYCVEVVDDYSGCSSAPACASSIVVGIDNEVGSSFKIYPNPAGNVINIEGDVTNIRMYNSMGQEIKINFNNEQINVSALDNGIYYMTLTCSDKSRKVEKVIIAK